MTWIREANSEPIPGYRLLSPLGSGGFGEVWKCEAPGGWIKAIKFVYGNRNSLDNDSIRADQEYKALQRIKEVRHPFVCTVEQTLEINGELIIVMEYADCTLHDKYQESQAAGMIGIQADELMRYMRDAAEALDFMYEKHNLQHLDVKPRNLFLVGDHVKVADFGLVKAFDKSNTSGILGGVTPLYASPETFQGKISPQSDQYSLAIVYQELLTGHRPYVAKNIRQMAQMHTQADPDLRSLPEVQRSVVGKALSKDPAKRFANCMDFVKALYRAHSSARIVELRPLAGANGLGRKPKTLADTMEDMLLEDDAGQQAAPAGRRQPAGLAVAERGDDDKQDVEVSDLGVTIAQPDSGSLRPTLIIGLGTFGRKAIMELRCRFLDRFGDLGKLPLLRFLYLDSDPEAGQVACNGTPQVALSRNDFYQLPLQPVVNYRRRSLDQLAEWLPRDKLYGMPRSLQTMGSRALGRLAFADNQQRLIARLRRDIQEISHPDTIYKSVENTGLALINNTPRIYILAAAGGGCSGMVADLGYALKRLLVNLRHPDAKVVTHLMCGSPQDPATPKHELANVYATLTELNHFSDPSIPFAAEYGVEGQRIVDQGSPMNSVYLLPLAHRSPDALEQAVAHLGSYLFHELTTPLGLRLEQLRQESELSESGPGMGQMAVPLRSFGTYAVWFPRGLMLNLAARHACKRLIDQWVATDMLQSCKEFQAGIQTTVHRFASHPELSGEALAKHIGANAQAGAAGEVAAATPGEVLSSMLAKLADQLLESAAQDDAGNWCKQAMSRVRDWMGAGADDQDYSEWRKTKLARSLAGVAQKSAELWEQRITKDVYDLMAFPGARVAGAETALESLYVHFKKTAAAQTLLCQQQAPRSIEAWHQVETAMQECITGSGGFRLFGGRSKTKLLRNFLDRLSQYAHLRLAEELNGAAKQTFNSLVAKLADRLRDLGFCRQRLRHLQENLDRPAHEQEEELNGTLPIAGDRTLGRSPPPSTESFWETIRQSDTARVVLPGGQDDLEQAALTFLLGLKAEQWLQLDRELHEKVLEPQGGLNGACMNGDLTRQMALPLLEGASQFLNHHLPIMDVAQIIKNEVEAGESAMADVAQSGLREQTRGYLDRSAAPWVNKQGRGQHQFLLVPASNAGKGLSESVLELFPELRLVRVPGQSDLMFLCEQGSLSYEDLTTLLKPCRAAYENAAVTPVTSPHARFDVIDWLPLEP